MNLLRIAFAAIVTITLCSAASAADNKKLLVGKWEVTKADDGTVALKTTIEFTADGKLKIKGEEGGQKLEIDGTYTVDADSFTFKISFNGQEEMKKITIKKLDDKELETKDPDGKSVVLKKVK